MFPDHHYYVMMLKSACSLFRTFAQPWIVIIPVILYPTIELLLLHCCTPLSLFRQHPRQEHLQFSTILSLTLSPEPNQPLLLFGSIKVDSVIAYS